MVKRERQEDTYTVVATDKEDLYGEQQIKIVAYNFETAADKFFKVYPNVKSITINDPFGEGVRIVERHRLPMPPAHTPLSPAFLRYARRWL